FRHFWFEVIPAIWRSMVSAVDLLEQQRPGAILFGTIGTPEELGLVMAAQARKGPVVPFLHGGWGGGIEIPALVVGEGAWRQVIRAYGQGQNAFLQGRPVYHDARPVPVAVGSARIDEVRAKGSSENTRAIRARVLGSHQGPLVVYVPGVFFNNYFRFESHD